MDNEESIREYLGYPGPAEIRFAGRAFRIHPDGLVPLMRYVGSGGTGEDQLELTQEQENQHAMSAAHRLLEDCIINFGSFSELALTAKISMEDINDTVAALIRYYTCRSHWSAMRLLRALTAGFADIDGQLLRSTGRSVAALTAREACNLLLAICLENREEEDRIAFLEDLEYEGNAEGEALAMARKMMQERLEQENDGRL